MTINELNQKLCELIDIVSGKKIKNQKKIVSKTNSKKSEIDEETIKQIAKITNSLQELRLYVKYLLFDIEATRRERDKFKSMLDDQPPSLSSS